MRKRKMKAYLCSQRCNSNISCLGMMRHYATLWITSRSTSIHILEDSFLHIPVPTKRLNANNTVSIVILCSLAPSIHGVTPQKTTMWTMWRPWNLHFSLYIWWEILKCSDLFCFVTAHCNEHDDLHTQNASVSVFTYRTFLVLLNNM